jgi:hypothetical protein
VTVERLVMAGDTGTGGTDVLKCTSPEVGGGVGGVRRGGGGEHEETKRHEETKGGESDERLGRGG